MRQSRRGCHSVLDFCFLFACSFGQQYEIGLGDEQVLFFRFDGIKIHRTSGDFTNVEVVDDDIDNRRKESSAETLINCVISRMAL